MIIAKCPLRVSVAGGSTDLQAFINSHGRGAVVSFSINLYTYITLFRDRFGQNSVDKKYNVVWSQKESVENPSEIKNDIARIVIQSMSKKPLQCWFTADVSSSGSGLASSSSYMVALVSAINSLENHGLTKKQIIEKSWELEKMMNPLTGFQDPWGVAAGGLNFHELKKGSTVISTILDPSLLHEFNMYLLPTNFSRLSTHVLEEVQKKVDKKLLDHADEMRSAIINCDKEAFIEIIKEGWTIKKKSTSLILGNEELVELDTKLESTKYVKAHRLIGAGNGGYFLLFTDKDTSLSSIELEFSRTVIPIDIDYNGISLLSY